ncbi:MAG: lipopolysaccharide biosynthesis protein [Pseudomonadota bacterium]
MTAQVMAMDYPERPERSLKQNLRAIRRRAKSAVVTATVAFVIVVLVVMLWPTKYESSATILIEQQEIPQDLVRSTITSYADQRIQVLSQQVMTTSNLLAIVRKYDLYEDLVRSEPREVVLEEMRDDTRMRMISAEVVDPRSGRPTSATIAFTLAFRGRTPDQALKVTNELTNLFLEKNVATRTESTSQTLAFLSGEANRVNEDIQDLEAQVSSFKSENVGRLPEQNQLNLSLLDRAERELQDVERQMRSVNERRIYLDAEVVRLAAGGSLFTENGERIYAPADRLKMLVAQLATYESLYSDRHPDVVRTRREIAGLEATIAESTTVETTELSVLSSLRAERNALAGSLSANHPDVRDLDRRIAEIESRAAAEGFENTDPGYRQLKAQLAAVLAELQSLEALRGQLRARVADYQSRLETTPVIEKDYRALQLDLEDARRKYGDLKAREMEARLAQNLESDRRGERLTVIEPPLPAEQPASPDRPLLIGLGAILALGLGAFSIFLAESLDDTVRDKESLERVTALPVLGLIPEIRTSVDRQRRTKIVVASAVVASVLLITIVGLVHTFFMPVDVLFYASLRRLGAL